MMLFKAMLTNTSKVTRVSAGKIARSSAVGFAAAQAADSVRFAAGQIDRGGYGRRTIRNAAAAAGTFVGGFIGSMVAPGSGTAVGGTVGGMLADIATRAAQGGE